MRPAELIAAQRASYLEKLTEVTAQLDEARAELPAAEAAARTAQADYDALLEFVTAPLRNVVDSTIKEMPAATHSWLGNEAKEAMTQSRSALHAAQRRIKQLEYEQSKWQFEISFLDGVLSQGGKVAPRSLMAVATPARKPPVVDFDTVVMPAVHA